MNDAFDHVADHRTGYDEPPLEPGDLAATPLEQLRRWYDEAAARGLDEPNAVVLATAGPDGPSARVVLLRGVDSRGLCVFTNLRSRKGRNIAADPRVALVFDWHAARRQVQVRGIAEPLPRGESATYFASRPYASRISAWASRQSEPLASRTSLEQRWADLAQRWPDTGSPDDVPLPDFWGGLLVRAREVELWQGRANRLHDRLVFLSRTSGVAPLDDAAAWRVERWQP